MCDQRAVLRRQLGEAQAAAASEASTDPLLEERRVGPHCAPRASFSPAHCCATPSQVSDAAPSAARQQRSLEPEKRRPGSGIHAQRFFFIANVAMQIPSAMRTGELAGETCPDPMSQSPGVNSTWTGLLLQGANLRFPFIFTFRRAHGGGGGAPAGGGTRAGGGGGGGGGGGEF